MCKVSADANVSKGNKHNDNENRYGFIDSCIKMTAAIKIKEVLNLSLAANLRQHACICNSDVHSG